VRRCVLLGGPDVDHDQRFTAIEPSQQLFAADRLQAFSYAEVRPHQALYARQPLGRHRTERHPELENDRRGEAIAHACALPGSGYEPGLLQDL